MQSAENQVLGKMQPDAAVMNSAAAANEKAGLVRHDQGTGMVGREGVSVTKSRDIDSGNVVVTKAVGDQIVGQHAHQDVPPPSQTRTVDLNANVSIGEALEATAMSIGDKPIDHSDAAAIEAAEMRATGGNERKHGGLGTMARSVANFNVRAEKDDDRITISDLVADATTTLPSDKAVTREDAEGVIGAEMRNKAEAGTTPGGVGEAMAAAARVNLNESA
ncbi:hypothetical protein SLE2022_207380 [Rubroshorea leprosula]